MSLERLPLIDIAPLFMAARAGQESVARELVSVAHDVGAFYIHNHNIPTLTTERTFAQARVFHGLPQSQKLAYHVRYSSGNRGYLPSAALDDDTSPAPD